jgi:hypothetical protein
VKRLLLIVLLGFELHADVLPSHAVQGGLLMGFSTRLVSDDRQTVLTSAIAGMVMGALPDLIGMTGLHRPLFWPNYTWAHSAYNGLNLLPPYSLHLFVDRGFHEKPGENWWPKKAGLCLALWITEAILTYLFVKYILPPQAHSQEVKP